MERPAEVSVYEREGRSRVSDNLGSQRRCRDSFGKVKFLCSVSGLLNHLLLSV